MDELFCPHFWGQVVWPAVQSMLPFAAAWFDAGLSLVRRVLNR